MGFYVGVFLIFDVISLCFTKSIVSSKLCQRNFSDLFCGSTVFILIMTSLGLSGKTLGNCYANKNIFCEMLLDIPCHGLCM